MFFHRKVTLQDLKPMPKIKVKDLKSRYEKVGLAPIECNAPVPNDFLNDFGHLRNDIQQFLQTNDLELKRRLLDNLNTVTSSGSNDGMTIQDLFNSIIPRSVQTPADIQRFGRILAERFADKFTPQSEIADLKEKPSAETETPVTTFEETAQ